MAKNRFATKALNQKDEPILVALELNVNSMNIEVRYFSTSTMKEDEIEDFIKKFSNGEEVIFPENTTLENRSFTEESLLPDNIKIEGKSGAIRQLQNEWSYLLLNAKLFEQFNAQLEDIKIKAAELKGFSSELFDEAKEFWEKVLEYKKEREISQEKLAYFKEEINGVFDHLKKLKESLLKEKDAASEKIREEFSVTLASIDARLEEQGVHFKTIMEELKVLQTKLRGEDIKRDIKNILFDDIQARYDKIKVRREEVLGGVNNSRIDGLTQALERTQKSLNMDVRDLDFNTKKLNSVDSKLELQLREAKIKVLKDRITSKEEKVADIQKTLNKLTKKSAPKDKETAEIKKQDKPKVEAENTEPSSIPDPQVEETPIIEHQEEVKTKEEIPTAESTVEEKPTEEAPEAE
jgi:chromosome segregation ATPase